MASPFPGMDPFLESPAHWPDFHTTFIDVLAKRWPIGCPPTTGFASASDYPRGAAGKRDAGRRDGELGIWPDVVVERAARLAPTATAATPVAVATLEPVTVPLLILDEERETYIEILHRPERTLVAVLELLSPANKEQPGPRHLSGKMTTPCCARRSTWSNSTC